MAKDKEERKALRAQKKAAREAAKTQGSATQGHSAVRQSWLQLPTAVTAVQRARVHASAGAAGLSHESIDTDQGRALRVGTPTMELEVCPAGALDDEDLMELLFDKMGLVLMPLGPIPGQQQRQPIPQITLEQFIEKTRENLSLEEAAEVEQAEAEVSGFSAAGAQASGRSLLNMRCEEASSGFLGKSLLTFVLNKGVPGAAPVPLPAHKFSPHDVIAVRPNATGSGGTDAASSIAQGVAYRVHEDKIIVAVDDLDDSAALDVPLRLDKLANKVTYERMGAVLRSLEADHDCAGRPLLDIAFGARQPAFAAAMPQWTPVSSKPLDASQRAAVVLALAAQDLALVHGPPGTGKTTVLVECMLAEAAAGRRVLYCAASNIAVDNAVERLAAAAPPRVRTRLVRVGHPARLLPEVLEHSLEAAVLRSDASALAADCRAEAAALGRRLLKLSGRRDAAERREVRGEMRRLAREERARQGKAAGEVLRGAAITCCTLTGAHAATLRGHAYDVVYIDEAAQAVEVACWGAMLRARRAVLAGDHLQLPPTVISDAAAKAGLATTLFERLHRSHGRTAAQMLTVQYRMHEDIMAWASNALYGGRLRAHASVAAHTIADIRSAGPAESGGEADAADGDGAEPLVLVDTAGCGAEEAQEEEGASYYNDGEAAAVVAVVRELVATGIPRAAIGVITPYSAQRARLKALLPEAGVEGAEVSTVDGFQGREKEVIVISAVRSSAGGGVGFLADQRRMNVAVTRARRRCVLVGDSDTLSREPFLRGLVEHFNERGVYRSAQEFD